MPLGRVPLGVPSPAPLSLRCAFRQHVWFVYALPLAILSVASGEGFTYLTSSPPTFTRPFLLSDRGYLSRHRIAKIGCSADSTLPRVCRDDSVWNMMVWMVSSKIRIYTYKWMDGAPAGIGIVYIQTYHSLLYDVFQQAGSFPWPLPASLTYRLWLFCFRSTSLMTCWAVATATATRMSSASVAAHQVSEVVK